ncbi:Urb2/Npa2 family-domain-containing protein [Paraphoma chrysanthemicola]|uniref:Urb2/Npa2 family-domain-containing protein n=1 Tax=Paraphoma chrysanthemicola TaxID=798071 RepID=A0A8K0R0N7_9PLEO|nr:Urb2/Npa2 family-domain-containing protein [Paraphoma chrysanthemicola]
MPRHDHMAPMMPPAREHPAPTRPRLQSVSLDFTGLDEQIRETARIIRLPDHWATLDDGAGSTQSLHHVIRARAEWVLRWVLDRLKDDTAAGSDARGNTLAWQLLRCMIQLLPASRSAPHLRDAAFTTILERALAELPTHHHTHQRDASESSDSLPEDSAASRKRKRGTTEPAASKRPARASPDPVVLFRAIGNVLRSITHLSAASRSTHDKSQAELMSMVLRTESAQASRVLRLWLAAVHTLLLQAPAPPPQLRDAPSLVDLSAVLELWHLRIIDSADATGVSSEEFSTECLVPTLQLGEALVDMSFATQDETLITVLNKTTQVLDKLLTSHVLAPSRAAFSVEDTGEPIETGLRHRQATALSNNLAPLRAELLQAMQIEDTGEAVPAHLLSSFKAVAHLLDLAIRASPSRNPKARLAERAWIQAVFVSLAECAGCSLQSAPEFGTSVMASEALQTALAVLKMHNISISSAVLLDLFWYHCGADLTRQSGSVMQWALVAALIELDASIFVTEPRSASTDAGQRPSDVAKFIFDQISVIDFDGNGITKEVPKQREPSTDVVRMGLGPEAVRKVILGRILLPMISAFSRNRNLIGYIRRWDDQLAKSYTAEGQKALRERTSSVWEDRMLATALTQLVEMFLTPDQLAHLLKAHAKRLDDLDTVLAAKELDSVNVRKSATYHKACSSAVVISVILESIRSDDITNALKPELHSLFSSYATRVRDDQLSSYTRLVTSWFTLCQLVNKLWPVEVHSSLQLQQMLLHPLMEQASKDMSTDRQGTNGRRIDSPTRAAAMLFLLDACHHLQTVKGSEEQIRNSVRKIVKSLSLSRLEASEHAKMVNIFCTDYAQLLGLLEADAARSSLVAMLSRLSRLSSLDEGDSPGSLSQAIFGCESVTLQNVYATALSDTLGQREDVGLRDLVVRSFNDMQPTALSRERREVILDRLTELLCTGSSGSACLMSVMLRFMQIPNATAKISTDGSVFFEIGDQLQRDGATSRPSLQQFRLLCQVTLAHIISNQSQAQSRAFLGDFQRKLHGLTKSTSKVSATALAILRATLLEQKDAQLLSTKHYLTVLKQCLTDDGPDNEGNACLEDVLEAFSELPTAILEDATLFKTTATWLKAWINDNADLESYVTSRRQVSVEVANYVAQLHSIVAKYRIYPNIEWLIALTIRLAHESLANEVKRATLANLTATFRFMDTAEKLQLVPLLTVVPEPADQTTSYRILRRLISTIPNTVPKTLDSKPKEFEILPKLCNLLIEVSESSEFNALMDCIDAFLNDKSSLTSQHSAECVLSVLVKLTSRTSPALEPSHAPHIFARICETSRLVLLVHRNRLGGRSHLILPLLQGLLNCLFMPTSARSGVLPVWLRSRVLTHTSCLSAASASQYTRLLGTLCNPPQSSIAKPHQKSRKSKDLNDPVKAARERTSHFLYPLLASFCRLHLSARLEPTIRVKLMPGIWNVMGTAGLHKEELDAMFAGLGRSEKDVWRSIWSEWESLHGRRESLGFGGDA